MEHIVYEAFEDNKGVIRIHISKDRQWPNNDLQNTTKKTKDRAIRTQLVAPIMSLINKKGPGSVYDKWNISLVFCNSITVNQVVNEC
jgi:hypothetical protein